MSGRYATERQVLDDVRDLDDAARDAAGTEGGCSGSRPSASPQPGRRPASSWASTTARRPQGSLDSPPPQAQAFAEIIRRAARAD